MLKITLSTFAAALLVLSLIPNSAQAQSRVFVAAQGSDSNPCTFASPCRSFQRAHDVVAAKGEIDVLDPAGYGPVNINKSISIQGHGFAGISLVTTSIGIVVNAGANDEINLRGLLLDGTGIAGVGILFENGGSLNIQDTLVRNFAANGIAIQTGFSNTFSVTNTIVTQNAEGIVVLGAVNPVLGTIDHVTALGNRTDGLLVLSQGSPSPMRVTVSDSVFANSPTGNGINCNTTIASVVICSVRSSTIVNNAGVGLNAGGAANLLVTRSTITGNGGSWAGAVKSYGDNDIDSNLDTNPTPTLITHK